jgi:[ribosomal protein S5]-alanine N-acetyltransferase
MLVVPANINTPRLLLRRPKLSDASAVYDYGRDLEVARYVDWPVLSHIQEAILATENALQNWDSGIEYTWRVTVKPNDTPIGAVGCGVSGHQADLGFVLARRYWGKGYATEAAQAVFDWVASLEDVYRIQATCDVDNAASARVLEKIGMRREGILRRWVIRPNLPGRPLRDALLYSWVRQV